MGRLVNGLNGPFTGRIGTVIGSSINGIPYLKGPYKSRTKNISEKEILNRRKFAAAQKWLSPLVDFVRLGFKDYSERSRGFIAAKSYLLKNALTVEDDEIIIDPALVKVSYGDLPMSADAAFSLTGPNELTFSWDPGSGRDDYSRDQVMMLAYDPIDCKDGEYRVFQTFTGQFRDAGQDILSVNLKAGTVYHVYIAFISADRSRQSDSQYLGEIMI